MAYTKRDIDFVVGYVAPLDRWYVIPVEALKGLFSIRIFLKECKRRRYEKYREAWHLLRAK